jgi:tripartite-type tricarboxylate transporter receptor subunit TctC
MRAVVFFIAAAAGALLAISAALRAAAAQDWPTRPIKVLTPLAAGGAADVLGRAVGEALTLDVKQSVVIENRPGGGGALAALTVARAEPDGTTMLLGTAAALTIGPALVRNSPYDPAADLTPLTLAAELPVCLVVERSLPVRDVAELIAYAKANPGKLSFGSSGPNTTHHLAGELFKAQAGVDMIHVPYRGGNPAMTDLLAGQIQVLFATLSTAAPHIDSGRVRVLGMIEAARSRSRPEIPTIGETVRGYAMPSSWLGFLGPPKLGDVLMQRMNAALVKAVNAPNVRRTLEDNGFDVTTSTPMEFAGTLKQGLERYRKIIADAGITPQ